MNIIYVPFSTGIYWEFAGMSGVVIVSSTGSYVAHCLDTNRIVADDDCDTAVLRSMEP